MYLSKKIVFTLFLGCMLTASTIFGKQPIQVNYLNQILDLPQNPILKDGRVFVPLRALSEHMGYIVDWNKESKEVTIIDDSGTSLFLGTNDPENEVLFLEERIFVPLRYISESFKQEVAWVGDSQTVFIYDRMPLGHGYSYSTKEKMLYLKGQPLTALDWSTPRHIEVTSTKLSNGYRVDELQNHYGEPMIHVDTTVLVYEPKSNKPLITESTYYFQRSGHAVMTHGSTIAFTDGKKLHLIDTSNLSRMKYYDLGSMIPKDPNSGAPTIGNYMIEGLTADYALIRSDGVGLLTLLDLKTGSFTPLYSHLLSEADQEYALQNDVPYFGDTLTFIEEKDGTFYFEGSSIESDGIQTYTFTP